MTGTPLELISLLHAPCRLACSFNNLVPREESHRLSRPLQLLLAACHSLSSYENKVVGDPLDMKMFEASRWVRALWVSGFQSIQLCKCGTDKVRMCVLLRRCSRARQRKVQGPAMRRCRRALWCTRPARRTVRSPARISCASTRSRRRCTACRSLSATASRSSTCASRRARRRWRSRSRAATPVRSVPSLLVQIKYSYQLFIVRVWCFLCSSGELPRGAQAVHVVGPPRDRTLPANHTARAGREAQRNPAVPLAARARLALSID